MHWFVFYDVDYEDHGWREFESLHEAIKFIEDNLKEHRYCDADVGDFTVVEGFKKELEVIHLAAKVKIKGT